MNKPTVLLLAASLTCGSAHTAVADEFDVGQKQKAFTVTELTIAQGDTVKFINEDPFFHNIFSLSDLKSFDLGSFPQGDFRLVNFDETGSVEVECAIHPSMRMVINVQ